jgi:hypothetical protein
MPRGVSARNFALDLKKFGEVTREQAKIIFRKISLELDARIVLSTPVDTGRARGNWFPSLNSPSSRIEMDARDKGGAGAMSAAQGIINIADLGETIWFTNNLPYILPLENGHSGQAPEGMVDVNLNAVAAHYGGRVVR